MINGQHIGDEGMEEESLTASGAQPASGSVQTASQPGSDTTLVGTCESLTEVGQTAARTGPDSTVSFETPANYVYAAVLNWQCQC